MTCVGLGPIVFSACSHAGIVNVMKDLQSKAGRLHAVMGGEAPTTSICQAVLASFVGEQVVGSQARVCLAAALTKGCRQES